MNAIDLDGRRFELNANIIDSLRISKKNYGRVCFKREFGLSDGLVSLDENIRNQDVNDKSAGFPYPFHSIIHIVTWNNSRLELVKRYFVKVVFMRGSY